MNGKNKLTFGEKKESKKYEMKKSEVITNRLMIVFLIALLLITSLIMVGTRANAAHMNEYLLAVNVLVIAGAVLASASLAYMIICLRQDKNEELKTFGSKFMFGVSLVILLNYGILKFKHYHYITFLITSLIVMTVIYFVYYLYDEDFFIFSVYSAAGALLIYFSGSHSVPNHLSVIGRVTLILLAAAVPSCIIYIKKNKIKLPFIKKNINGLNFIPMYILAVLLLLSAVLLFITKDYAFYNVIAVFAFYLLVGIFYSVKLI